MDRVIETFVFAAPGREATQEKCLTSIEASDIGRAYTLCMQPDELTPREHWSATFMRMAESQAPLVLLLEDDCLVNEYVLHNIQSWAALTDPDFGAGWVYNPAGYGNGEDCWYNGSPVWYGTVGVVYWRRDVLGLKSRAERWMEERQSERGWDSAISWAVHDAGLRIRIHGPALVEHQYREPSLLGHEHTAGSGSSRGTFRPQWRRRGEPGALSVPERDPVAIVPPYAPKLDPDAEGEYAQGDGADRGGAPAE